MSQTGSSSACLTTDLTLPANCLDISTGNVDASCSIIHPAFEIIAENESLVGHGDGLFGQLVDPVNVNPTIGHLTSLTSILVVANQ